MRSHFEALKHAEHSSNLVPPLRDSLPRFLHQDIAHTTSGRVSLDLPRPHSPWSSSGTSSAKTHPTLGTPGASSQPAMPPPRTVHKRPMSMVFGSTPQLTPSVTINSPRSPPRTNPATRSGSRSPEHLPTTIAPARASDFTTQEAPRSPLSVTRRLATAGLDLESSERSRVPGATTPIHISNRISSIPPTINRADKPKIPSKPKEPQENKIKRLAPELTELPDKKISPFSTPPSSDGSPSPDRQAFLAQRTPPPQNAKRDLNAQANGILSHGSLPPSRPSDRDPRLLGFSGPTGSIEPRDPRALGFGVDEEQMTARDPGSRPTRASTVSDRSLRMTVTNRDGGPTTPLSQKSAQRHVSEQVRPIPPSAIPKIPAVGSNATQRDPRHFALSKGSSTAPQIEVAARRPPLEPYPEGGEGKRSAATHRRHSYCLIDRLFRVGKRQSQQSRSTMGLNHLQEGMQPMKA